MNPSLPPKTVELLQAFLAVAATLNISKAARDMGLSRPTVIRRLRDLEVQCAQPLMKRVSHSSYELTDLGASLRIDAENWLRQGSFLVSAQGGIFSSLLHSSPEVHGEQFHVQQHPLDDVWHHGSEVLIQMLDCWTTARGWLEAPQFAPAYERAVVARAYDAEFLLIAIGEKAPMMTWLGREWCRSSIGKPMSSTVISTASDRTITHSYLQALRFGTPWYDHMSIQLPRPKTGISERANYRRLVMPCKLPDGSPVVASVVELSDDLVIDSFDVPRTNQSKTGG
jgi:hypothetical protein